MEWRCGITPRERLGFTKPNKKVHHARIVLQRHVVVFSFLRSKPTGIRRNKGFHAKTTVHIHV